MDYELLKEGGEEEVDFEVCYREGERRGEPGREPGRRCRERGREASEDGAPEEEGGKKVACKWNTGLPPWKICNTILQMNKWEWQR